MARTGPWFDLLLAGLLFSAGAGLLLSQHRTLQHSQAVERDRLLTLVAGRMEASLRSELARSEVATRAAAAYLQASWPQRWQPDEFSGFAAGLLAGQSAMRALQWEPRVLHSRRAAFEREWQQRGLAGFQLLDASPQGLQAARERSVSYPILGGHAAGGDLPIGLVAASEVSVESPSLADEPDFIQVSTLSQAQARDRAEPSLSAPFRAVTGVPEQQVPAQFRHAAMSLRMPVYSEPPGAELEDRRALLTGFATAFVALPTLLTGARSDADRHQIAFRLLDIDDPGRPQLLYAHPSPTAAFQPQWQGPLELLGRPWQLQLMATANDPVSRSLSLLPLLAGLAAVLLLSLGWWSARQRWRALETAQARLRELTDGLPVGLFQAQPEADDVKVSYLNRGAARLLGRDEEALIRQPGALFDAFDADEARALRRQFRDSLASGEAIHRELLTEVAGQLRRISLSAERGQAGAAGTVINGVLEDVTRLREAGAQLEAFAEEQAVIVDSLPFALLFAEAGRITRANPALAQLLGYLDADELAGMPLQALHADEADYRALRKQAAIRLKAGKLFSADWSLVRRDGEPFAARLVGRRLLDREPARELWVVTEQATGSSA